MGSMSKIITQRELRNQSAAVMDAVERGETMVVTRNGRPVAELQPIRRRSFVPTAEVVQTFRGLPRIDLEAMKAEADALLGEDHVDG
jgi:prevent-host-death family protein